MRSQPTPLPANPVVPRVRRNIYFKTLFFSVFSVSFILGGLYFGFVFLENLSLVVASMMPEGFAAHFEPLAPATRPGGGNVAVAPARQPDERITFLLMGIDRRADQANEPTRADTMLLATYDPHTRTAGMLSIPRDMWVPIPISRTQIIEDRINTAHMYGDLHKYPGGGPALAKATVEYNLGVKIDHYARIDFDGFEQLINMVGGVTVDVPYPLKDDAYPTPDYGTERIYFPAGLQHLNGEQALKYARTRHADSDLGRARRQQQVLLAFREQALRLNLLPQAPALLQQLGSSITTDVAVGDVVELAHLAQEIDAGAIATRSLEPPAVVPMTSDLGADLLVPNRPLIAQIVREVFFDGRLKQEAAQVTVESTASAPAQASRAAAALQNQGVQATTSTRTPAASNQTEIIDYTGKPYTAGFIADLLQVDRRAIRSGDAAADGASADIRVVVAPDATVPLPRDEDSPPGGTAQ